MSTIPRLLCFISSTFHSLFLFHLSTPALSVFELFACWSIHFAPSTIMSHYSSPAEKDLKRDLENDQPALNNTPSIAGEAQVHDDVFGDITDEGPNYRAVR